MKRSCKNLKLQDIIIFRVFNNILNREIYECGTIEEIDLALNRVWISWLEGYRDRGDYFPFEKLVAVYDENGEQMTFGTLTGPSVLLEV
jgi:hypothetical protein